MSAEGGRKLAAVVAQPEFRKHVKNIVFVRTLMRLQKPVVVSLSKTFKILAQSGPSLSVGVRHIEDPKRSPKQASNALWKSRQLLVNILYLAAQNQLNLKEALLDKAYTGLQRPSPDAATKNPNWLFFPADAVDGDFVPDKLRIRFIKPCARSVSPHMPTAGYDQGHTFTGTNLSLWHLPTLPYPTGTLRTLTLEKTDICDEIFPHLFTLSHLKNITLLSVRLYAAVNDRTSTPGSWIESLELFRAKALTSCHLKGLYSGRDMILSATKQGVVANGEEQVKTALDILIGAMKAVQ